MQKHILQSQHNQKFHLSVCTNNPDDFFDWKITCLFYDAIHCLKALAEKRAINIGTTHIEIERSVSPLREATIMPLPLNVWKCYHNLYRYSKTARYSGITSQLSFETIKKIDHSHCLQLIAKFKHFIKSQGVPLT